MRITSSNLMEWTVIAAMAMTAACDNSTEITNAGGRPSNVVSSASSPASGDATLTATGNIYLNHNDDGYDMVVLFQASAQPVHSVTVTWDTNTHELIIVEHQWGDGLVATATTTCGPGNACDASKVAIDFEGREVTFTGLVLPDSHSAGTNTSTLNGTLRW